jgi:glutathione S-transferase
VPVLVDGDTIVVDSMRIVQYLDDLVPAPPLFPRDDARYAEMMIFIDWFNRVWKLVPNRIEAELAAEQPDHMLIVALGREMTLAMEGFEALLTGRQYLMGDEFSAADCAAFPFLKYAAKRDPADGEAFHRVLDEYQELGDEHFRLRSWIKRVDAMARA